MNMELIGWILGPSITVVGWWILYRQNRAAQRELLKRQQLFQVYSDANRVLHSASASLVTLTTSIGAGRSAVAVYKEHPELKSMLRNLSKIVSARSEAGRSLCEVISEFESWEAALADLKSMWERIFDETIRLQKWDCIPPLGIPLDEASPIGDVDADRLDRWLESLKGLEETAYDLIGFLHDYKTALQNVVLYPVFGKQIEYRKPENPAVEVLKAGCQERAN